MDSLVKFFMEHWILTSVFVVIALLLLINEWRQRTHGLQGLSVAKVVDLINHSGAVVIDVRASEAFKKGHIVNSINLPKAEIANRLNQVAKYKKKPVVLVCHAGLEAPKAAEELQKHGFENLSFLSGGVEAWKSDAMPVVTK